MVQMVRELPAVPCRPATGHKGTFGRVLIVAGSRGMSGAAILSGLGALRGGAGLVTVASPQSIVPIVAGFEPSYLTLPLPETEHGQIAFHALDSIRDALASATVAAMGPGWGQSPELVELAWDLYQHCPLPLVVDADALNALAHRRGLLAKLEPAATRILTPHPGEFGRLLDCSTETVQAGREALATEFARTHRVTLLLKGAHSLITDGQRLAINPTGNSGLATGGTGDVLTGLIVALIAQGLAPFDAAQLGAYLHGRAGDLAAQELSQPGLIASDLPWYITKVWRELWQ